MNKVDPFDLTPLSIRHQQSLRSALNRYTILTLLLGGVVGFLVGIRWREREQKRASLAELMAQALPIRDWRLESLRLQQSNAQLAKIVVAVASAEPRDSMLQSLAAVTEGVTDFGLTPRQLHLRLAVEPTGEAANSGWAAATMKVTLETKTDALALRAHESIAREDRFTDIKTLGISKLGNLTRAELVGIPHAEVLLP